jgi:PIN domain nuclease of toxin-antitoxin system
MIILDTHIWIWWVDENPKLSPKNLEIIQAHQATGLGISIISCWEIAKLVEKNRLSFECSLEEWLELALSYYGVQLLELSIPIILQSTQLAGFHADPSDQIIVATAKVYDSSLLIGIR